MSETALQQHMLSLSIMSTVFKYYVNILPKQMQ